MQMKSLIFFVYPGPMGSEENLFMIKWLDLIAYWY